jgi:hypothetical protein
MLAHNTAVMAGVASLESKLDNELLFTDDGELSDHFDAVETLVKEQVDDVQQDVDDVKSEVVGVKQDVGDVKTQVIEAHSHIEALIGLPADIPSINRRKRDGKLLIGIEVVLNVVLSLQTRMVLVAIRWHLVFKRFTLKSRRSMELLCTTRSTR